MLFSLVPFAYLPSYSSQADGPDALPYPVHRLSAMQDTLAALADKAVADEIAREDQGLPTGPADVRGRLGHRIRPTARAFAPLLLGPLRFDLGQQSHPQAQTPPLSSLSLRPR